MTNPTNFFGWQMPENTSLVTDLPADFEVFGQAVDTDFQDLLGGTTGQVLSKTSGTDLDFTWVDPTAGDITGVTAGTGISGGGTSGTVTVTNSMATAIDAKGDLIAGTADDTFSRLAIGANDTVLTADSAEATGLKWATPSGSMTLISTTTLTGASVTLSSIPQTYKDLRLVMRDFYPSTNNQTLQMTFNGDTGANYTFVRTRSTSTSVSENVGGSNFPFNDRITQQTNTDTNSRAIINIYDYATALDQLSDGIFVYFDTASNTPVVSFGLTYFPSTSAAITSITINVNSGNLGGGTLLLYGVN